MKDLHTVRQHLTAPITQPLISVIVESDGMEEVHYFTDGIQADAALASDSERPAIKLAGAWSDLDADVMFDSLERIRHENKPTPPIIAL